MMVHTPISSCSKNVSCLIKSVQRQASRHVPDAFMQSPSSSYGCYTFNTTCNASKVCSFSLLNGFQALHTRKTAPISLKFKRFVSSRCGRKTSINVSTGHQNMNMKLLVPKQIKASKVTCNTGPVSLKHRSLSASVFVCLLVCFSTSKPSYAELPQENENKKDDRDASSTHCAHGKKVLKGYSVIGIPGDGRCLFRSVAHGACIRSGKSSPNENLQRELADELRARVADEFIQRREETEWMPITVYMHDQDSGGLISIAEYGQEYGKENPITVLYHGFGHYDALHVSQEGGARPRL